jgi:isopentenyl-diphosphate delta-isomerase
MGNEIRRRKEEHLELCANGDVEFRRRTTLLENVQLVHQSLPEMSADEVQLDVDLLGKRLRAPLVIAAMTGGTEQASRINRELSAVAEARGYGFGLGSQRAMLRDPDTADTFSVRSTAPTALVLGNIGVVQARERSSRELIEMVERVGADALCVHLNPAMELIQPEGDRDFRGGADTLARLVRELPFPVVAKETGSGVGLPTVKRLRQLGVSVVDVSGAGGTSWTGVEAMRAREGDARALGELLWDWGVPTAAAVAYGVSAGMTVIATGGIRSGLDVARALAIGATAAGVARPVLQAFERGGREQADAYLDRLQNELRTVMVLCGARTVADLQRVPRVITGELKEWLEDAQ